MTPDMTLVITGFGAACHLSPDTGALWARLVARHAGLKPEAPFDTAAFRARNNTITDPATVRATLAARAPELAARLPEDPPRGLVYGLAAATEALTMAGLAPGGAALPDGIGLSLGTTSGSDFDRFAAGAPGIDPALASPDGVITALAAALGLNGPRAQISNACTSSAAAIVQGAAMILSGRAETVLVGGADHARPADFAGFNALRAMSPQACRAFDRDRDGMIIGDGAAILVLERAKTAARRGARVLARLEGFGLASDAHHATRPRPEGLAQAIRAALAMAARRPEDYGYVNCHGTGTPANDITEAEAITAVFGTGPGAPVLSSTKTVTGHLLGSAAALEAVITLLILRAGLIPEMAHSVTPDPDIALPLALGRSHPLGARCALSTTLGFGGSNACLAFALPDDFERAA